MTNTWLGMFHNIILLVKSFTHKLDIPSSKELSCVSADGQKYKCVIFKEQEKV